MFNFSLRVESAEHCLASAAQLSDFVRRHPRLFVLTGAGISQASGIPTYRDELGNWHSKTPIQHAEFIRHAAVRQRYWARSFVGWPAVRHARPNAAHLALARLEQLGYVHSLVTQNVDRLHQQAGQDRVTDLHGRLDQVVCLDCGATSMRSQVQEWLQQHNPRLENLTATLAPDGDADVSDALISEMRIPVCFDCSGLLKPDVVFYGSTVPKTTVHKLSEQLSQADALLVVGSSLMVYSSYRFAKLASEQAKPLACINQGLTRADSLFSLKVAEDCSTVLSQLAEALPQRVQQRSS